MHLVLWVLLFATGLTAAASAQVPPVYDLQNIVQRGVLRVALTHFDLPAFHWRDNAEFKGPEVEFVRQIAQALGVGIDFDDRPKSFDEVIGAVATGADDIGISKSSQT